MIKYPWWWSDSPWIANRPVQLCVEAWCTVKDRIEYPLIDLGTDAAIWLIGKLNRTKDDGLSWRLHRIADHYDKHPTGEWE